MSVANAPSAPYFVGTLRSAAFDQLFIFGVAALAMAAGALVVQRPDSFTIVLAVNLWLLGYHHVIATFTRIAFDRESVREHRFVLFGLPFIVFAATFAMAYAVGPWVITSVYLYWQWYHYTRQSWGVSQVYRSKCPDLCDESPLVGKLWFYLVPTWGILYRSWQAPEEFIFAPLRVVPTPGWLVDGVGVAAGISLLAFVAFRLRAWLEGRLPLAHTAYMVSHFAIFLVGYVLIEDITNGWLVINVWHNAQYLLFVWHFNTNRFRDGVDPKARFLSTISQPKNKLRYAFACLSLTTLIYGVTTVLTHEELIFGIPLALIFYQALNFHHYIVDSKIWKVRTRRLQTTLDLKAR